MSAECEGCGGPGDLEEHDLFGALCADCRSALAVVPFEIRSAIEAGHDFYPSVTQGDGTVRPAAMQWGGVVLHPVSLMLPNAAELIVAKHTLALRRRMREIGLPILPESKA